MKPEAARRITKSLQDLERDHGYRMFVVLERALLSTTASDFASQLQEEWLPDGGRNLRLALITIGGLSLLALCGMGVGWMMGRADKKQSSVRVFPTINLPERLGASYGGGCGASQNFSIVQTDLR